MSDVIALLDYLATPALVMIALGVLLGVFDHVVDWIDTPRRRADADLWKGES